MPVDVLNLSHLWQRYKSWVIANPQVIGDVETTIKWASYFVAGRITNSSVATEMIYSLSNLLCLLNDRILMSDLIARQQHTTGLEPPCKDTVRIKMFMTTLDYCEVFLELSGQQLWGRRGRWFVIVILQIVKCIGRFLLVLRKREKIVRSPPIPSLDRNNLNTLALAMEQQQRQQRAATAANSTGFQSEEATFKLKRSGKVMRRVEGAPTIHHRDWKPLERKGTDRDALLLSAAEYVYICKPLVHLGSVGLFGYNDWRSWATALAMDCASIRLYYNNRTLLDKEQRLELSRRCLMMFMYLMRSPFYDRVSRGKIEGTLGVLSRNIPFARYICKPIAKYIPVWQETYFYVWST